ncbi:MAG: pyridoxal phosphate-dependent aminotransferase family protein [Lunatimonas sp.]|uniref:aminotransferase class I/II-fold pyridoxal phosphate-dependent enzyme n=1 Tax=Lunatimonas sp. TaxID=2060141 RepID=UPI00263B0287|nr:pyridoxal phosphate-dependent aminotransferase family protein [Lunatimonas sp.]MCC5938918.1 pyridoxal phosphate-dependent aminotransferase family protein [Lunatimonas sp.]
MTNTTFANLKTMHLQTRRKKLPERVDEFSRFMAVLQHTYRRTVCSASEREVEVVDPLTRLPRRMLMFASNNYLGLANHPYVIQQVKKAMDRYGAGIGGPPLLNGYIKLIEETEERVAAFKQQESAILFSSGFMTNLGILGALTEHGDTIIYDELSHASFYDGLMTTKAKSHAFRHNDVSHLSHLLESYGADTEGSVYVCVEGVYSMDGDMAPLGEIAALCLQHGAALIVDDAHGTGVLGEGGRGTASQLNCEKEIALSMGTFSKVFATCGGFVAASKPLAEYMRYYARPYMFSASIPPPVAATVLAGLEVMEREPWLRFELLQNMAYAVGKLRHLGLYAEPQAAILTLAIPAGMDIRKAAWLLHQKGIFVNSVEYPAVPANKQRFRVSLMATHTKEDIDGLATALDEVWNDPTAYAL